MKTIGVFFTALLATALTGCATSPAAPGVSEAAPEPMSNVERYRKAVTVGAERKNVEVYWVNPPKEEDLDEYTDEDDG